ncbi:MAG: hypothetical protein PHT75_02535 [Bacilli bacterium]|nr:hypothetical protein [Bacilli bacterium]MDD3304987.1 hypothetical protein [Bacilli bacterium]MDD4053867.1 hypothetical protein [Bacilli bacterium]MDD4411043.1 hypothetical protein [Bacilli bacterium]
MKKILLTLSILLLAVIAFLLIMHLQKEQSFYLDDEYYGNSSLIELDSEKLEALERDKKTFIVFVYQPLCAASYDLDNYITEFTNTYKMSFYKMLFSSIKDTSIAEHVKYCPSVVIYHKGKVIAYLDANSDKNATHYESVENLKKWLTKYILLKD